MSVFVIVALFESYLTSSITVKKILAFKTISCFWCDCTFIVIIFELFVWSLCWKNIVKIMVVPHWDVHCVRGPTFARTEVFPLLFGLQFGCLYVFGNFNASHVSWKSCFRRICTFSVVIMIGCFDLTWNYNLLNCISWNCACWHECSKLRLKLQCFLFLCSW